MNAQNKMMVNHPAGNGEQPRNFTERKIQLSEKQDINRRITSLEIAEIADVRHKNLLQSIRLMEPAWTKVTGLKFQPSEYTDVSGRKLPMYEFGRSEFMFIISKFNDEIRAILVMRWEYLENLKRGRRIKVLPHERRYFEILNEYLVRGDIKRISEQLGVTAGHVSRVKRGVCRSWRVMRALIDRCGFNKVHNITDGYPQLKLDLFPDSQKQLA